METILPTPTTARVYVNLPEGRFDPTCLKARHFGVPNWSIDRFGSIDSSMDSRGDSQRPDGSHAGRMEEQDLGHLEFFSCRKFDLNSKENLQAIFSHMVCWFALQFDDVPRKSSMASS